MQRQKKRVCSLLHYITAVLFLLTPVLSGAPAEGPKAWVPLGAGVLLAAATFAARDRIGPARIIGGPTRHGIELAGAVLLTVSPWLFGFAELMWRPHLFVGQIGIGVAILTGVVGDLPAGRLFLGSPFGTPQASPQGTPISQNRSASVFRPARRAGP